MNNQITDGTMGLDPITPLTLEKFKETLEAFKSIPIEPVKYFYTETITYGKILDSFISDQNYMIYKPLGSIPLIVDNDIEPGQIIYCEPGIYDIWKTLKASPWIDKNDKSLDLWKAADSLFKYKKT